MSPTGLKREAGPAPLCSSSSPKRQRDCHSSDCSSSSACSSPVPDAADYECSICLQLLVAPVVGQCGHDFCKTCLDEWRERTASNGRAGVSCPVCRQLVMAPGVQSLGVCVRLQRMIERQYPQQLQQRRAEIAAAVAERAKARQQDVQEKAASIQELMRARFNHAAQTLGRQQQDMQPTVMAPYLAAHRSLASPSSQQRATSPVYGHGAPALSTPDQQVLSPAAFVQPGSIFACAYNAQATASPSGLPTPWQCPARDVELRQSTMQSLMEVFISRRPNMAESFRQRLPNLVRKLEEVLYRTATSLEEYANPQLLQARVQMFVRQLSETRVPRAATPTSPQAAVPAMQPAFVVQPLLWAPVAAPTIAVGLPVHQFVQAARPMAL